MKKTDKNALIKELSDKINEYSHFYVTDTLGLNAGQTSDLRRECYKNNIKMMMVKNTLFKMALEQSDKKVEGMDEIFKGTSVVLFSNTGNAPAKLIKEFRKKTERPVFKGAFVEESVYLGGEQLEVLTNIKSKEELLGEVIGLLQSPVKNVISALQSSGGNKIHRILQTLSEKE
jgi:large subunit ribosomal protein L10